MFNLHTQSFFYESASIVIILFDLIKKNIYGYRHIPSLITFRTSVKRNWHVPLRIYLSIYLWIYLLVNSILPLFLHSSIH